MLLHTAIVACVAVIVHTCDDLSEAVELWRLFFYIDFPVSVAVAVLIMGLGGVLELLQLPGQGPLHVLSGSCAVMFGFLGGLQYYFVVGRLIAYVADVVNGPHADLLHDDRSGP